MNYVSLYISELGFENQLFPTNREPLIAIKRSQGAVLYSLHTPYDIARSRMKLNPVMTHTLLLDSLLAPIPEGKFSFPSRMFEINIHSADGCALVTCAEWTAILAPYRFSQVYTNNYMHMIC